VGDGVRVRIRTRYTVPERFRRLAVLSDDEGVELTRGFGWREPKIIIPATKIRINPIQARSASE
jgi:hypothetical protein